MMKKLIVNERGLGVLEYLLILCVVAGIAIYILAY